MKRISATLIGIFLAAVPAVAHQTATGWRYPTLCCNPVSPDAKSGDCQAISSKTVRIVVGGFRVTIGPGDHALATKPHVFMIPTEKVQQSEDGDFHLCLFPGEDNMRCFFAPPMDY